MSPKRNLAEDPVKRSMLLTALYIAQEQYGHLNEEAIERVSQRLGVLPKEVYSTASFYTLYTEEPTVRYRIQVCEGLSCYLCDGAENLLDYIRRKLGLKDGQTQTADGKFSLEIVQCLAACDTAPNIRINDSVYGNLTQEKIDDLLNLLLKE
jgi:NADH-quinone oxidoreductase subunit E